MRKPEENPEGQSQGQPEGHKDEARPSRRDFVRLSGVTGAAALLAGAGGGTSLAAGTDHTQQGGNLPLSSPTPSPSASPCPKPSTACGDPNEQGVLLWDKVRVCLKQKQPPPQTSCLNTTAHYVILHGSPETDHNYLLVPTCRIKGIECPFIWGPPAYPFYWNDAWNEAQASGAAPVKYSDIGLGINSKKDRTEQQLHIHMAGILPGVQGQLNKLEKSGDITSDPKKWQQQIMPVEGFDHKKKQKVTRTYRALVLTGKADLNQNMFQFLGRYVTAAQADMENQTMVVTPRNAGGFYVLNSDPALSGGGTGTCDLLLVYDKANQ
ncbi:CDP-diacylglycerol diphosphatase [Streptomyces sp. NPDC046197]|uniref:CDP-diacylglycerol diphosphatase n=1 Tax=Streptomyces sp. NPDC046197 TaxID=3154337 RepID=UPI003404299E